MSDKPNLVSSFSLNQTLSRQEPTGATACCHGLQAPAKVALRKNRGDLHEDGPLRHRLLSPMADLDEDILPSILPLALASSAQLTNNIVAKGRLMSKMMLIHG